MRLYRILGAGWAGTQADAKAAAKEANAPWHEYDVQTDKTGLLAFLNERNVPAQASEIRDLEQLRQPLERDPMDAAPARAAAAAPAAPTPQQQDSYTAIDIQDFILNRASVDQASTIMACLATRFAELVKEHR